MKILSKVVSGKMDVTEASLNYTLLGMGLPETVKILLSKAQAPEMLLQEGCIPNDEELEHRYQEALANVKQQE